MSTRYNGRTKMGGVTSAVVAYLHVLHQWLIHLMIPQHGRNKLVSRASYKLSLIITFLSGSFFRPAPDLQCRVRSSLLLLLLKRLHINPNPPHPAISGHPLPPHQPTSIPILAHKQPSIPIPPPPTHSASTPSQFHCKPTTYTCPPSRSCTVPQHPPPPYSARTPLPPPAVACTRARPRTRSPSPGNSGQDLHSLIERQRRLGSPTRHAVSYAGLCIPELEQCSVLGSGRGRCEIGSPGAGIAEGPERRAVVLVLSRSCRDRSSDARGFKRWYGVLSGTRSPIAPHCDREHACPV